MEDKFSVYRLSTQESQIVDLFRQELADESTAPEQWRFIVNASPGAISSQFERVDRVDLKSVVGAAELSSHELETWVTTLIRRQVTKRKLPTDAWSLTVEVSPDRIRAFRARKGAKTLPKAVGK